MKKYSIIYPYLARPAQFEVTLKRLIELYGTRGDIELIIVPDLKCTYEDLRQLYSMLDWCWMHFLIKVIPNDVYSCSSARQYNLAADHADGEYLILTNPECAHATDVLKGFDEEFGKDPEAYLVAACVGMNPAGQPHEWYQHSQLNPRKLHFCTAISLKNFLRIRFDEDYCTGLYYEDNDFIHRVERANLIVKQRDDLLVHHLYHEKAYQKREDLIEKNKQLYILKWETPCPNK